MKIFGIVGNHGEISLSRRESENWKYLRLWEIMGKRGKDKASPEQWEEKESSDGSVWIAAVQDVAAILPGGGEIIMLVKK